MYVGYERMLLHGPSCYVNAFHFDLLRLSYSSNSNRRSTSLSR